MINEMIEECIYLKQQQQPRNIIPIRIIPRFTPTDNEDFNEIILDLNFFW